MVWDRRIPMLSKQEISSHGFAPGARQTWQVPFVAAGVSAAIAAAELWALLFGSAPLWTSSRDGWKALHSLLGPYTNLVPALGLGALLLVLGVARLRSYKRAMLAAGPVSNRGDR